MTLRYSRLRTVKQMSENEQNSMTNPLPVFPDIGCDGDCGFIRAGVGWQCIEGTACGRYVHPTDEHWPGLERFHLAMLAADRSEDGVE